MHSWQGFPEEKRKYTKLLQQGTTSENQYQQGFQHVFIKNRQRQGFGKKVLLR